MTACVIYRCSRQDQMYLYLREDFKIDDVPEDLRKRLGELEESMRLELTPERKLARVEIAKVIAALKDPGYFLQMPPAGGVHAELYFGD